MAYKILRDSEEINDLKERLLRGEFPVDLSKKFGIGIASVHLWKKKFQKAEPDLVFPMMKGQKRPSEVRNQMQAVETEPIQITDTTDISDIKNMVDTYLSRQVSNVTEDTQHLASIQRVSKAPLIKPEKTFRYIIDGVQMNIPQSVPVEIDSSAKHVSITKDTIRIEF